MNTIPTVTPVEQDNTIIHSLYEPSIAAKIAGTCPHCLNLECHCTCNSVESMLHVTEQHWNTQLNLFQQEAKS